MRVNREDFLRALIQVQPALSAKAVMEQSDCFVFTGGEVLAYNDEVCCRVPSLLDKKFTGAVYASPLLNLLSKLTEDEIEVVPDDGELRVTGKRRCSGIRMEKDILLPVQNVDAPEEWKPLHRDFGDGLAVVQEAAGSDASKFALTCVHLHPKWIEACDGYRVIRYRMKTGVKTPRLVRKESLKHVVGQGMTEFSETASWIHFRGAGGLVYSCRQFVEEYPDLTTFLDASGDLVDLPKGLHEAAEKAEVFSEHNKEDNLVTVTLRPNKVVVEGNGPHGWYRESKKLVYAGPEIKFMIIPKLLGEISQRYNTVEVSHDRLKVEGGKWRYVTVLAPATPETPAAEEA